MYTNEVHAHVRVCAQLEHSSQLQGWQVNEVSVNVMYATLSTELLMHLMYLTCTAAV